jgi:23S rRNA pseudouridine955/2504/2580 synthase
VLDYELRSNPTYRFQFTAGKLERRQRFAAQIARAGLQTTNFRFVLFVGVARPRSCWSLATRNCIYYLEFDMEKVELVEIDAEYAGQRIDNYLITRLKGVPKSRIYRILRKGEVRANGGRVKPHYRLQAGDTVRIPPVRVSYSGPGLPIEQLATRTLEHSILYEDKGLLVINKPSGLAVHGGSGLSYGVIEILRQMRPEDRFLELVHRLDRGTSGCLLIAKKRSRLRSLHEQIRNHELEKTYITLVCGHWAKRKVLVDAPLKKNELKSGERISVVAADGKPASTRFKVLRYFPDYTLIEAKPVTGRTHQIRVHVQYAGHHIVGDDRYGDDQINKLMRKRGVKRLFLHASNIKIPGKSPDGEGEIDVTAPLDSALQAVIDRDWPD